MKMPALTLKSHKWSIVLTQIKTFYCTDPLSL